VQLDAAFSRTVSRTTLWTGIVALLVGLKLVGSYFVPELRTRGEMLWSGALLFIYTARILSLRSEFERRVGSPGGR
jgi:hypothetical protein